MSHFTLTFVLSDVISEVLLMLYAEALVGNWFTNHGLQSGASHYSIILTYLKIFRTFLQDHMQRYSGLIALQIWVFICYTQFYRTHLNYAELCYQNQIKILVI